MSLMQGGVFAAIPLVADREKLILKRLGATPLRRWQLVGSNILVRLLVALVQTVIIVGVGTLLFGLETTGRWLAVGVLHRPRVAGVHRARLRHRVVHEDRGGGERRDPGRPAADAVPVRHLLPDRRRWATALQTVARLMPLTYLADALRQVMVDGIPFASLWVCVAVLFAWLIGCFAIAARYFRWQ